MRREIAVVAGIGREELMVEAKRLQVPYEDLLRVHEEKTLPVPIFSAGGVATPADAALMMQLGAEAVFVGSGIFRSEDPEARAKAVVQAVTHFEDREVLLRVSTGLRKPMPSLDVRKLEKEDCFALRGN